MYHIIQCNEMRIQIALLMSSMFSHGMPVNTMEINTIKPVPKNKFNLGYSYNYHSIAISSVLGEVVDHILLDRF